MTWRCRQVRLVLFAVSLSLLFGGTAQAQVFGAIARTVMTRLAERTARNSMIERARKRWARMRVATARRARTARAARLSGMRRGLRDWRRPATAALKRTQQAFLQIQQRVKERRRAARSDRSPEPLRAENQPRAKRRWVVEKWQQVGLWAANRRSAVRHHHGHPPQYAVGYQMLF